jgi:tRNA nucleotidyltransferase (CCA-adding enzyme)
MMVIDEAASSREKTEDPYCYMLLGLCHDLGKTITTTESDGRIHSYEHETKGMPLIKSLVRRFTDRRQPLVYLSTMVPLHMLPFALAKDHSSIKATNRMFDRTPWPEELILFAIADKGKDKADPELVSFLYERLAVYREYMARPFVSGEDLIEAGLKPSPVFSKALDYAHKLRLAGVEKENALRQILAYARKPEE